MKTYHDARQNAIREFERNYLAVLLREHKGNLTTAAKAAGIERSSLYRMIKRHGVNAAEYRRQLSEVAPLRAPDPVQVNREYQFFVESRR